MSGLLISMSWNGCFEDRSYLEGICELDLITKLLVVLLPLAEDVSCLSSNTLLSQYIQSSYSIGGALYPALHVGSTYLSETAGGRPCRPFKAGSSRGKSMALIARSFEGLSFDVSPPLIATSLAPTVTALCWSFVFPLHILASPLIHGPA